MLGWTMSKLADMLPRTPRPDCLLAAPHPYVCVSLHVGVCSCGGPPSLSEHQTTQLSPETCQTQLGHLPPSPPILSSSFLPLLPLLAPQTPAGGFDTLVLSSKGNISIFICFEDSKTLLSLSFLIPKLLLISIKQSAISLLHCVCFRCSVIDIDMIWEGKEQKSLRPICDDCFFFFCCF